MIEVKKTVQSLIPYRPNDYDCKIKLDANESKNYLFSSGIQIKDLPIHLYPDTASKKLREAISKYIGIDSQHIIAGNGSSEMIELILKTFIEKNDYVLSFEPSFSMYEIYTTIYDAKYVAIDDYQNYQMDVSKLVDSIQYYQPKVVFLCSPNNPTGQTISNDDILKVINASKGLVVLDEAYIEFFENGKSMVDQVSNYSNLIILRTMSKAFGLAGIRLGYAVSNLEVIEKLYQIKSPFNLNALSQYVGVLGLSQYDQVIRYTDKVKRLRHQVYQKMIKLGIKAYISEANFIFFKSEILNLFDKLIEKDVLIRAFKGKLKGAYRVTIGNEEENNIFLQKMEEIINENQNT